MSSLYSLFNFVLEILATAVRQEQEIKTFRLEKKKQNYPYLQIIWLSVDYAKESTKTQTKQNRMPF